MTQTERIIEDAEVAALYLRTLIDKGVPVMAAVSLTCSYVSSKQIADRGSDRPKEPWQDHPVMDRDDDFGFDEQCEAAWRSYLAHFREHVYPMFREFGVSFDAALTCWFVNRLRNAIPDDDSGNEPWQGGHNGKRE